MFRCVLCRFDFTLDDVVSATAKGSCICLHCYLKETGTMKEPSRNYRRELVAAAEGA